jgi:hypothetical protein
MRPALLDLVRGATFDDFLFNPQYSVVERRDPSTIDLTCRFSTGVALKRPIVSANMDTGDAIGNGDRRRRRGRHRHHRSRLPRR